MTYKVLGMIRDGGLGKDMNSGIHVPYMNASDRAQHLIAARNGKLFKGNTPFDTNGGPSGAFIFVMDKDGAIYSANKRIVKHHSSFLSGNPAAAAGHWVVRGGKVEHINGQSGHYQPTRDYLEQFVAELRKRGVALPEEEKMKLGLRSSQIRSAAQRRNRFQSKWFGRSTGIRVADYANGVELDGERIEVGSHWQGQVCRLYPGSRPQWSWF